MAPRGSRQTRGRQLRRRAARQPEALTSTLAHQPVLHQASTIASHTTMDARQADGPDFRHRRDRAAGPGRPLHDPLPGSIEVLMYHIMNDGEIRAHEAARNAQVGASGRYIQTVSRGDCTDTQTQNMPNGGSHQRWDDFSTKASHGSASNPGEPQMNHSTEDLQVGYYDEPVITWPTYETSWANAAANDSLGDGVTCQVHGGYPMSADLEDGGS